MRRPLTTLTITTLAITTLAFAALAIAGSAGSSPSVWVKVALNQQVHRQIVVDRGGRTLYVFIPNARNTATCIEDKLAPDCSKVWQPLIADGARRSGRNIDPTKLRTIRRADGRLQVTYYGHPLYRFAGYDGTPADTRPGDVHAQGLFGLWYVLSPTGKPITSGAAREIP